HPETRHVGVHLGRILQDTAHLKGYASAAVIDEHPVYRPFLQLLDLFGWEHADRRSAERRDEVAYRGRREPQPETFHVLGSTDRFFRSVYVTGLMRQQQEHFHTPMFVVEVLRA